MVLSFEYGMNLTENMLERCPVKMDVVRLNWEVEDSGWYEWMLMRWSSEPEASKRPDLDQLEDMLAVSFADRVGWLPTIKH